jgi:hypothetical protein
VVGADEDHADRCVLHHFAKERAALVEAEDLPLLRLGRAGIHILSLGAAR